MYSEKNLNSKNINYIYDMLHKFAGDKNDAPGKQPATIKKENIMFHQRGSLQSPEALISHFGNQQKKLAYKYNKQYNQQHVPQQEQAVLLNQQRAQKGNVGAKMRLNKIYDPKL
jgi:hypothetical protein